MSLNSEILSSLRGIQRVSAIAADVKSLPYAQRQETLQAYLLELPRREAIRLDYLWPLYARDSQLPPEGDWDTWLILAGRGFGKTRTGAEWIRSQVEDKKARRIALVARTTDEAQSVMIEGESGIINISPHWNMPSYEPSKRKLTWPNGAFALVFSSHEPDQLRGPQFDAAWCDELASWQYPNETWDNLSFALRLGRRPRSVVTTTPKAIELVRSLPNRPGVHVTRGSTYDNQDNLPPAFFNGLIDQYDGTRIGQQEIHAELIDEDEEAIWKREWIEKARLGSYPPIARIVVAVDPALSRQAHKLRDRNRRRRSRHASPARLRPRRRVRTAHPQQHGAQSRLPLRQVQRHPDHRRGQRRWRDGRIDHQEPPSSAHFPSRPSRHATASKSGPSLWPHSTSRGESTTSAASPPSKTRCVPGPPTLHRPSPPTAPTPWSTPSPNSS